MEDLSAANAPRSLLRFSASSRRSRRSFLAATAGLSALLVAGCSAPPAPTANAPAPTAAPVATTAAQAPPAAQGPAGANVVSLRYANWQLGPGPPSTVFKAMVSEFEKANPVKIQA